MTAVIAHLTLVRLFRGRAVWISLLIAGLPVAFAAIVRSQGRPPSLLDIFVFDMLLLAILPGMFVASSIGEDIEDRTTTYVWSRPIPRWSVLAGKLLALAPLTAILCIASWVTAVYVGRGESPAAVSIIALAGGAIVCCIVAAAIATLVPKHGMSLTIAYMLFFDLPVGAMPLSLAELSVTHHMRTLSAMFNPVDTAFAESGTGGGLAVLAAVWLAIALWRIRRLEA